jgi:hypothetical protein
MLQSVAMQLMNGARGVGLPLLGSVREKSAVPPGLGLLFLATFPSAFALGSAGSPLWGWMSTHSIARGCVDMNSHSHTTYSGYSGDSRVQICPMPPSTLISTPVM